MLNKKVRNSQPCGTLLPLKGKVLITAALTRRRPSLHIERIFLLSIHPPLWRSKLEEGTESTTILFFAGRGDPNYPPSTKEENAYSVPSTRERGEGGFFSIFHERERGRTSSKDLPLILTPGGGRILQARPRGAGREGFHLGGKKKWSYNLSPSRVTEAFSPSSCEALGRRKVALYFSTRSRATRPRPSKVTSRGDWAESVAFHPRRKKKKKKKGRKSLPRAAHPLIKTTTDL